MIRPNLVSILAEDVESESAKRLSALLDATIVETPERSSSVFILDTNDLILRLRTADSLGFRPFSLDFSKAVSNGTQSKSPLIKAMGKQSKTVMDATAGWCGDALALVDAGFAVVAIEQNPIVAAMVEDAINSMSLHRKRAFQFVHSSSTGYLDQSEHEPDVVYLDPMYPESSKSAKPKKPMQLLQYLSEACQDSDTHDEIALFNAAMKKAKHRVVVKRPHRALPLAPGKVGEVVSKLVRFDLYKPFDETG